MEPSGTVQSDLKAAVNDMDKDLLGVAEFVFGGKGIVADQYLVNLKAIHDAALDLFVDAINPEKVICKEIFDTAVIEVARKVANVMIAATEER